MSSICPNLNQLLQCNVYIKQTSIFSLGFLHKLYPFFLSIGSIVNHLSKFEAFRSSGTYLGVLVT
jgi:hypothetical protein